MSKMQIIKASHHFTIRHPTPQVKSLIYQFASNYTQVTMEYDRVKRKKVWRPVKTFGIHVGQGSEFRFHIGQWEDFWLRLRNLYIPEHLYEIIDLPMYEGDDVDIEIKGDWKLRDYQQKGEDYVFEGLREGFRRPLFYVAMGKGKTRNSLHVAMRYGKRFFVLVLAKYVDKWIKDIQDNLEIESKEIAVIEGSKSLRGCTFFPGSGLPMPKVFVASLETMGVWWKQYEEDPDSDFIKEEFGCLPPNLFQHLGIGLVINDEAHQHPHAVYKAHCYAHVPLLLSLSATMLTKDPVLRKIQSAMFPVHRRYVVPMDKYIIAHASCYQIMDFDNSKIRISERGQTSYSHTAFEKSILHHRTLKDQYAKMILDLIDCTYIADYIKGDRAIIFVSTVNMAQLLTSLAQKRWPKLDIRTYLQEDPYENVLEPDIRFTTVIGAGTAVDIENLRHAYMTQALDSPNAMAQALGRLRELDDRDVHFHHLYCSSIPKHVQYTENTMNLFKSLVKEHGQNFLTALKP